VRRVWRDYGLSISLILLFTVAMLGQTLTGWRVHNEDRRDHGAEPIALTSYLGTGHFAEPAFENWESEFLQMAFYVLLTAFLTQRGSAESKRPDTVELV
jgi:hypothetical protein